MPTFALRHGPHGGHITDNLRQLIEQHVLANPNEPFGTTARLFGVNPHTVARIRSEAGIPAPSHRSCPACRQRQAGATSAPVTSGV